MMPTKRRVGRWIGRGLVVAAWSALAALVGFFALAGAVCFDLKAPAERRLTAGTRLDNLAGVLYGRTFTPMWQAKPDCVQFDPELLYVPKPGAARFSGPEFETVITMTSDGLRRQPEAPATNDPGLVVIAGDSFAMGWGVGDAQTFSALLAREHRHPTVNAGVSSYGTARELLRLRRLGLLARATTLVIQYSANDAAENREFLQQGGRLAAARDARRRWEESMRHAQADPTYPAVLAALTRQVREGYAARGLAGLLPALLPPGPNRQRLMYPGGAAAMAADFVAVLDRFPELEGKRILVVELNAYGESSGFLPAVATAAAGKAHLEVLRLELTRDDFFRFDWHLTPAGHKSVAVQLDRALRARGGATSAPQRDD